MEYLYNKELTLKVIDETNCILLEARKGNRVTIEVKNHILTGIVEQITENTITLVNQPFEIKNITEQTTMQIKQIYQIALSDIESIYNEGEPIKSAYIHYMISTTPYLHIRKDNEIDGIDIKRDDYVTLTYVEHRVDDHFFMGKITGRVIRIDQVQETIVIESELAKTNLRKDQEYLKESISKDNPDMLLTTISIYAIFTLDISPPLQTN